MKGLTSIELAILLAIIIVIAVAVGWYMYTTFTASTSAQAKLIISQATYAVSSSSSSGGTLTLVVSNPGPVQQITIQSIYLSGQPCGSSSNTVTVITSTGTFPVSVQCPVSATPGTTLQGYVVLSTGTTFPFTAVVTTAAQS
ncbi:MAG: sodium:proline symporter [Thermoproteus sp.]